MPNEIRLRRAVLIMMTHDWKEVKCCCFKTTVDAKRGDCAQKCVENLLSSSHAASVRGHTTCSYKCLLFMALDACLFDSLETEIAIFQSNILLSFVECIITLNYLIFHTHRNTLVRSFLS